MTTTGLRFEFGKNWEDYAKSIDAQEIEAASRMAADLGGSNS